MILTGRNIQQWSPLISTLLGHDYQEGKEYEEVKEREELGQEEGKRKKHYILGLSVFENLFIKPANQKVKYKAAILSTSFIDQVHLNS